MLGEGNIFMFCSPHQTYQLFDSQPSAAAQLHTFCISCGYLSLSMWLIKDSQNSQTPPGQLYVWDQPSCRSLT